MKYIPWVFVVSSIFSLACTPDSGARPTFDTSDILPQEVVLDFSAPDSTDTTLPNPDPVLWEPGADLPNLPPWIIERLEPDGISTWAFAHEHTGEPPAHMHLADYAVGNGHLFSLIGHSAPFNTLHSMIGPDYQKDDGYFSDLWIEVANGAEGQALSWKREWIGRARRAPMVLTHAEGAVASLTTLDVAPPDIPGLLRLVVIRNLSGEDLDGLWVRAHCARPQADIGDGGVREERGGNIRDLRWLNTQEPAAGPASLATPVGPLPAGAVVVLQLAVGTGLDVASAQAAQTAVAADPSELIAATLAAWEERLEEGLEVLTPDPRVNDYLTGAQIIVLSQIAGTGAICPMSQYTRTWLRDCGGPVKYLARSGFFEAAKGIIDYLWLAAAVEGGLRNSYRADLDAALLEVVDPPDWASMPVETGRTRAESPSYIPLMYGWYIDASGDDEILDGRLPMLEHTLMKQGFQGDLLYFSGDETFRTAMAIAHGLPIDESFEEGYLSANSSFLWIAGAQVLAPLAAMAGAPEVAETLLLRREAVIAAAVATYLQDDGSYTPYVSEADLAPAPAPYEDVNTKPIWSGALHADSDGAPDNLDATIAALGGEDGVLVSPLPDSYIGGLGLPIEEGIYTGMSPGYFLQNVAAVRHPAAEAAFNALQHHAAPGGSTPEYAALDGPHPLQLMYDPTGGEPADYTARYRPWEGAIVADAALEYLFGIRQDAVNATLGLSPSLPNNWSWSEAQGVRVGETRLDVRVEQIDGAWSVRLTHRSGSAIDVDLAIPWPDGGAAAVGDIDGAMIPLTGSVNRWEVGVVQVERFELAAGAVRVVTIK